MVGVAAAVSQIFLVSPADGSACWPGLAWPHGAEQTWPLPSWARVLEGEARCMIQNYKPGPAEEEKAYQRPAQGPGTRTPAPAQLLFTPQTRVPRRRSPSWDLLHWTMLPFALLPAGGGGS